MNELDARLTAARERCAPFRAEYPFEHHFARLSSGHWLHYLDEGPKDAPVLLCLHGNPSWSFLWRKLVARLAVDWRVIAPDHLGLGLSDKPQEYDYTLAHHTGNLAELLAQLRIARFSLALHDWGGAIGMALAARAPLAVEACVISNTAAFRSTHMPLRIAACRLPLLGALAVRGANAFARGALHMAVEKPLSRTARLGLLAPYASWSERVALHRFVLDIPRRAGDRAWDELLRAEQVLDTLADRPALIVWGERDWCFTPDMRREWKRRWPHAEELVLEQAGHYLFEDQPEAALGRIAAFLAGTRSRVPVSV